MRFLMGWVVVCGLGCTAGCGSSGTSPVVEYNAALEAWDKDFAQEKELKKLLKSSETPPADKKEIEAKIERIRANLERIERRIKEVAPRI